MMTSATQASRMRRDVLEAAIAGCDPDHSERRPVLKTDNRKGAEAEGAMTSYLLHDIRNHLQTVASAMRLIRRHFDGDLLPEGSAELFEVAAQSLAFASTMTTGISPSALVPVCGGGLDIDDALSAFAPALSVALGGKISLFVTPSSGGLLLTCGFGDLQNAVLNLAVHARDAMPCGGQLIITAAAGPGIFPRGDASVCVTVRDTGTGMSRQDLARACLPMFTTKQIAHGRPRGLGLASVSQFVRKLGGHLEMSSDEGRGTEVRLYLPASLPPPPQKSASARPPPAAEISAIASVTPRSSNRTA